MGLWLPGAGLVAVILGNQSLPAVPFLQALPVALPGLAHVEAYPALKAGLGAIASHRQPTRTLTAPPSLPGTVTSANRLKRAGFSES